LQSLSLSELNEFIRRVLALNFAEPVWVRAEINQVNQSRGHFYFNLVEKGEDESILAKTDGVLWSNQYRKLRIKLGMALDQLLQDGVEVLLYASVDFHERYGLKLVIEDIDPAFTMGKLALKRQETLRRLKAENLLGKNKELPLPAVVQHIAVLSSETAAGYVDFMEQLRSNNFGYAFYTTLYPVAVQGTRVVEEVKNALKNLSQEKHKYDAIVIIRGGGSKLDLMGFDEYEVGKAIAESGLPVITGIGHEIDESVADIVANRPLKTPTAVAEFLIQRSLLFENDIINLGQDVHRIGQSLLKQELLGLETKRQQVEGIVMHSLQIENYGLNQMEKTLVTASRSVLNVASQYLQSLDKQVSLLAPDRILERGFTLTTDSDGNILKSSKKLKEGDAMATHFHDGTVKSKVIKS
jgi:exodeoxyribonuclease VII large subunit